MAPRYFSGSPASNRGRPLATIVLYWTLITLLLVAGSAVAAPALLANVEQEGRQNGGKPTVFIHAQTWYEIFRDTSRDCDIRWLIGLSSLFRSCFDCVYDSGCCCAPGSLKPVTKRLTKIKSVTKRVTLQRAYGIRKLYNEAGQDGDVKDNGYPDEDQQDATEDDTSAWAPVSISVGELHERSNARHVCPRCPAGKTVLKPSVGKHNVKSVFCCPARKTKTVITTIRRTKTKTINRLFTTTVPVQPPFNVTVQATTPNTASLGGQGVPFAIVNVYAQVPAVIKAKSATGRSIQLIATTEVDSTGSWQATTIDLPPGAYDANVTQTTAKGTSPPEHIHFVIVGGSATTSATAAAPLTGATTQAKMTSALGTSVKTTTIGVTTAKVTTTAGQIQSSQVVVSTTTVNVGITTNGAGGAGTTSTAAAVRTPVATTTGFTATTSSLTFTSTTTPPVVLLTSGMSGSDHVVWVCRGDSVAALDNCAIASTAPYTFNQAIAGLAINGNYALVGSGNNFAVCNINGTSFTRCRRAGPSGTDRAVWTPAQMGFDATGTKFFAADPGYGGIRLGEWGESLGGSQALASSQDRYNSLSPSFSQSYGIVSANSSLFYVGERSASGGGVFACQANGIEPPACTLASTTDLPCQDYLI